MKITTFRCIGTLENGKQCDSAATVQSDETVPDVEIVLNPDHPTWPFLCSRCANAPARRGSRNTKGIVIE